MYLLYAHLKLLRFFTWRNRLYGKEEDSVIIGEERGKQAKEEWFKGEFDTQTNGSSSRRRIIGSSCQGTKVVVVAVVVVQGKKFDILLVEKVQRKLNRQRANPSSLSQLNGQYQ